MEVAVFHSRHPSSQTRCKNMNMGTKLLLLPTAPGLQEGVAVASQKKKRKKKRRMKKSKNKLRMKAKAGVAAAGVEVEVVGVE
jgi:hypothetical protein